MDHFTSTENTRPWWDDVAHLRGDDDRPSASAPKAPRDAGSSAGQAAIADVDFAIGEQPRGRSAAPRPHARSRSTAAASRGSRRAEREPVDWFAQEARGAGRRSKPRVDSSRPERPRATLVDLSPDHAFMRRAQQVRRAPGERPTVTITGRPDAALPPQVRELQPVRARRTREGVSSLVSSPDRLILWAVGLGLLMILASIGTASAHAAASLTLLR